MAGQAMPGADEETADRSRRNCPKREMSEWARDALGEATSPGAAGDAQLYTLHNLAR